MPSSLLPGMSTDEDCIKALTLRHCIQVQQQQRDYAKQLAYGLLYGKGPHALAVDLSCTVKVAGEHQDSFLKSIPAVVSTAHHHSYASSVVLVVR